MKVFGSKTATWLKQINDTSKPEVLYAKVTERIDFTARKYRDKKTRQTDILNGATSTVNTTQITLRTSQVAKVNGIKADDTVIWDGLAYTVVDIAETDNSLSLYGIDYLIYLER